MALSSAASEALRLHLDRGPCTAAGWVDVDYALSRRLARSAPLRGAGLDARLQPPQISRIAEADAVEPEASTRDGLSVEAQKDGA
jgi:hypothetical protein